jgi:hypothetical protein
MWGVTATLEQVPTRVATADRGNPVGSIKRMAIALGVVLALSSAAPVSAAPLVVGGSAALAAVSPSLVTSSPPPCQDAKYNLQGPHWTSRLRWQFKAGTTPSYLSSSAVLSVLKHAFGNIKKERNDCGRPDTVSATSRYKGTTSRGIGVTKNGTCGRADGHNTIGFGALPIGYLALTCVRSIGGKIVEADLRFSNQVNWSLSLAGCVNAFMLEAVATHELGHAYGLDHVGEANHGRLTMSVYIDGTCENQESTLGLGDMLGLEALY